MPDMTETEEEREQRRAVAEGGGFTVTDKKAAKQAAAEQKRLEQLTAQADALEEPPGRPVEEDRDEEFTPLEARTDSEPQETERQARINELRDLAGERALTQDEAAEMLRLQAAEEQGLDEAQTYPAVTAFLVVVHHDGSVQATPDVNLIMSLERMATVDDMYGALAIVQRDIESSITAKQVVFASQMASKALQEQAQARQMVDRLNLGRRR